MQAQKAAWKISIVTKEKYVVKCGKYVRRIGQILRGAYYRIAVVTKNYIGSTVYT